MNDHETPLVQRVVTVRTPENIELEFVVAGPASRAAAYMIDFFIMTFVGQIAISVLAGAVSVLFQSIGHRGAAWSAGIAVLASFVLYNGYFIVLEWLWNGQTPGKRFLHLRVIKQGGYALRFFDTLLRNLLRVVDFLPLFYGVGLTSLLLTRDSQRIGDIVAGTLVVHQEPVETESLLAELPAAATDELPLPAEALALVPGPAVSLIGQFFRERNELTARARLEVAAELVGLVHQTSGLRPRPAQSAESFLAAVVRPSGPGLPWSFPAETEVEFHP